MIEIILSVGLFTLFLGLYKELRSLKLFLIVYFLTFILLILLVNLLNFNYKAYILPISFLTIYQPYRFLFKKIKNREPILILRGTYLNPQEEFDISPADYLFTFLLILTPIIIIMLFYF